MSIEKNKQVVVDFIQCVESQDYGRMEALLADDFEWWIPSRSETLAKLPTRRDKTQTLARVQANRGPMKAGMSLTPFEWTAEGNRVAVEAEGKIVWESGLVYNNLYHMAFVVRDGKLVKLTEYCDLLYAWETNPLLQKLGQPKSA